MRSRRARTLPRRTMLGFALIILVTTEDAPITDLDRIQGTWVVIGQSRKFPDPRPQVKSIMVMQGDDLLWKTEDGEVRKLTFRIDPSKTPKTFDPRFPVGRFRLWLPGIYRLGDDT